jgi:hypothetical protein
MMNPEGYRQKTFSFALVTLLQARDTPPDQGL